MRTRNYYLISTLFLFYFNFISTLQQPNDHRMTAKRMTIV